ncbi:hypothetical protein LXL04_008139 [Taraxacum kok-saghyz]
MSTSSEIVDSGMATGTMNLFPAANKSSASPVSTQEVPKKHPESAQMTMFYAGQVIVLDDFPAEKAMEIMMLAGKGKTQTFRPASDWSPKPTEPANLAPETHRGRVMGVICGYYGVGLAVVMVGLRVSNSFLCVTPPDLVPQSEELSLGFIRCVPRKRSRDKYVKQPLFNQNQVYNDELIFLGMYT